MPTNSTPSLASLEPSAAVGLLLQVLSSASNGNDVSSIVAELIQVVFSRPASSAHVRKLAYEVCRHATLSVAECHKLWDSVRSDVNSNDPEVVAAAVRFLACLPPSDLAERLVVGQLSELLTPCLSADAAVVRAAAVQSMSSVLLMTEVQQAAAGSQGLANAYEGLWDAVTDSLLDERPFVVGLAAAATAQLLAWGSGDAAAASGFSGTSGAADGDGDAATSAAAAAAATSAGFMMSRVADRAAQRLAAALGPVLEMCGLVPVAGQVAVCDMLLALVQRVMAQTLRASAGDAAAVPPAPPGVPVPNLATLVASAGTYLSTLLQAGDAAARTEACGAVLVLAGDVAAAGPGVAGAAAGLPQALVLEACQAMLGLKEREYMEAGLADMCEALAGALPALLPSARATVLRRLWPLAGRITDVPRRAHVFATAWHSAVAAEMDTRTAGALPGASAAAAGGPSLAAPAPSVSASSDPLSLLAGLAAGAAAAGGSPEAAGIVTAVPRSCSVAAILGEPYVEVLMTGKPPAAEANGAFAIAQASANAAAAATTGGSFMRSMSRSAPPPPSNLPRSESTVSGTSVGYDGAAAAGAAGKVPGGKPEKEKKGVLGGLFGRNKTKARGAEAAAAAAAAERAEEQARQEAAAAAAATAAAQRAAAAAAAAAPSSQAGSAAPSVSGGSAAADAKAAAAAAEAAAAASARSSPHATLRHELLQCLLQQLAHHPAAATAAELVSESAAAARHDRHPPSHPASSSATSAASPSVAASGPARRLGSVTQWVAMTADVLQQSAACVGWEPYVVPAITSQASVGAAGRAPVDFNSLTGDLWLGLLQASVQAARAAQSLLGHLVAEATEAAAAAAAAGQSSAPSYSMGYGTPYGMGLTAGALAATSLAPGPEAVTAESYYRGLLSYLDEKAAILQGLIVKLLSHWQSLSSAARPRVTWVAAHCMSLPGHWDDRWELLLGCLDALMVRGTDVLAAARRADVMGSALAGSLFKAGRQAWSDPSKPFLFDIASASALCEAPEYEVLGLLAGLAALQHLAARLTNVIAEAVPHGAAGAAHGQVVTVAKRLEALMRHFIGTELAGTPHVRDWVKRIMRSLATLLTYTPPVNLPVTVAALGLIAQQAHAADGTAAAADDDDSSDASSAYNAEDGAAPPPLNPMLAAAAVAIGAARAAERSVGDGAVAGQALAEAPPSATMEAANGDVAAESANGTAGRPKAGATSSYLVHSAVAAVPMWGYPFAPLSSTALHNSKRARRHRALVRHLSAASAAADAPRPVVAAALAAASASEAATSGAAGLTSPASGPELSTRTMYKLDSEAFWASLPVNHSPWQELTGPSDPLLLRGCVVRPQPGRSDPSTVTVLISVVNRLPVEILDAELSLKTNGPLLSSARRAAMWELPRIAPHDRAAASFKFKVLGYGDLQLHPRLQLCPGPARVDAAPLQLNCLPLELPPTLLLRPPTAGAMCGSAAEFFRSWGTLPARAELSGVCTWPGSEGGALLLSALLRQPLACAWMQHVPAVCGFQAGFAATTAMDDSLAVVLTTQLMPPPSPGASAESFCSFSIRSSSPDLILSLQSGAAAWLTHVTSGTASLGGAGRTAPPGARPPLHPRVGALLQTYAASAAQLAVSNGGGGMGVSSSGAAAGFGTVNSFGLPASEMVGAASGAVAAAAATAAGGAVAGPGAKAGGGGGGNDVSVAWLKSAALSEWQRLNSLSAV